MGIKIVLVLVLSMIVCSFCGNDFKSVNRHVWRCQARMEEVNPDKGDEAEELSNISGELKCICGKVCKGLRGLRGHQRSCRSIKPMSDEISVEDTIQDRSGNVACNSTFLDENPNIKPGIKLPKTNEEWELANTYFKSQLNLIDINTMGVSH